VRIEDEDNPVEAIHDETLGHPNIHPDMRRVDRRMGNGLRQRSGRAIGPRPSRSACRKTIALR